MIIEIENTKIFNTKLKRELIKYFDKLNKYQLDSLNKTLDIEKKIIIDFLKSLKGTDILLYEEIKKNIELLNKKNRNLQELLENKKEDKNIINLL